MPQNSFHVILFCGHHNVVILWRGMSQYEAEKHETDGCTVLGLFLFFTRVRVTIIF